nr:hypothetical protein [Glycomyces sp. NEAU-S30]
MTGNTGNVLFQTHIIAQRLEAGFKDLLWFPRITSIYSVGNFSIGPTVMSEEVGFCRCDREGVVFGDGEVADRREGGVYFDRGDLGPGSCAGAEGLAGIPVS